MNIFILIIVTHWIADFIFQSESWATNKSKSNSALLKHTFTYSWIWLIAVFVFTGDAKHSLLFAAVTFALHTATDYVTSRIVSKRFSDGIYGTPIPNVGAFSLIGFDQVLHYLQLIITYHLVFIG